MSPCKCSPVLHLRLPSPTFSPSLPSLPSPLQARLTNKKFVDKAPPAVVAEVQADAAQAAEQLAAIAEKVDKFRQLA